MIEHFDAIVIGAGISGETCAHRLRLGGMHVALVEREYIGGEPNYSRQSLAGGRKS
jgi:dihydrolipoamide dehydrogenase